MVAVDLPTDFGQWWHEIIMGLVIVVAADRGLSLELHLLLQQE